MNLSSLSGSLSRLLNFGVTFIASCITLPACAKAPRQRHGHVQYIDIQHDPVTPPMCSMDNPGL